ncbi:MAG TPA: hypothetical protein VD735_05325 [Candidatus Saccharimonadales bacterium]|nr:hypothetical protein [Candidatus Saccharimonadales bacterium]
MYTNLITIDPHVEYATNEAGPIIIALAFVIAVGGLAAAAILLCGWQKIKSVGVNVSQKRVEIICQ